MSNNLPTQLCKEEMLVRGIAPISQRATLSAFSVFLQIASACGAYELWSNGGWAAPLGFAFFGVTFGLASYSLFRACIQRCEIMPVSMKPAYLSADPIICQKVNGWGTTRSIVLDIPNRRLRFYRCFTFHRFLARTEEWHRCELDDVIRILNPWQGFRIDTDAGHAVIQYGSRLTELRDVLEQVIATRVLADPEAGNLQKVFDR